MVTTPKKARFLIQYANHFFAQCTKLAKRDDNKRELIRHVKRVVFGDIGKKAISDYVQRYVESGATSFVSHVKLGQRAGDGAEKVLVRLT